jgi:hypothetical protein
MSQVFMRPLLTCDEWLAAHHASPLSIRTPPASHLKIVWWLLLRVLTHRLHHRVKSSSAITSLIDRTSFSLEITIL